MPVQLPSSSADSSCLRQQLRNLRSPKAFCKFALRSTAIPLGNGQRLPLRIRPVFVIVTSIVLVLLGVLGFSSTRHTLFISDKPLHFICFAFSTALFYWIWEVEEYSRRIWYWRRAPTIITAITCFFFGGLISEVVQGFLPEHVFDWGDVFCNWLGSCLGLFISEKLEAHHRHQRELRRLYQPLDVPDEEYGDIDEYDAYDYGVGNSNNPRTNHSTADTTNNTNDQNKGKSSVNNDVWGASEEIFSVGDEL